MEMIQKEKKNMRVLRAAAIASILFAASGTSVWANPTAAELDSRIWEANEVLKELAAIPEQRVPPDLLRQAKAVAVFPNTVKAGFIMAGQFGRGVILHRNEETGKWTAPAFFRISGGSVGFQIGGQASDIVLVITNERGVLGVLENKFTLGVDGSVAAGPVGRDAEAKTDWQLKASVLSYSRTKGLFAGVAVDGMVINQDREANSAYYGAGTEARTILMERKVAPTPEGEKLLATLEKLAA